MSLATFGVSIFLVRRPSGLQLLPESSWLQEQILKRWRVEPCAFRDSGTIVSLRAHHQNASPVLHHVVQSRPGFWHGYRAVCPPPQEMFTWSSIANKDISARLTQEGAATKCANNFRALELVSRVFTLSSPWLARDGNQLHRSGKGFSIHDWLPCSTQIHSSRLDGRDITPAYSPLARTALVHEPAASTSSCRPKGRSRHRFGAAVTSRVPSWLPLPTLLLLRTFRHPLGRPPSRPTPFTPPLAACLDLLNATTRMHPRN